MVVNEFEPDDIFGELNQKFANVSLEQPNPVEDVYREILFDDVSLVWKFFNLPLFFNMINSCMNTETL